MNDLRVLRDLIRRGVLWTARHGVLSSLRRTAVTLRDRRAPSWRSYNTWLEAGGGAVPAVADGAPIDMRISVLVPVHDAEPGHLDDLVASVRRQGDADWELVFVDDGGAREDTALRLGALADDPRVTVVRRDSSGGISAATNEAAGHATGRVFVFVDHDDLLADGVLPRVARAFAADASLDLAWTDEDHLTSWGLPTFPMFRAGPSPWQWLGFNAVTHLVAVRRTLFESLGGLRSDYDGAQDHDFVLRASESARRMAHLPGIGYHWRRSRGSVAATATAKPWAFEAGRRAVEDACRRRALPVEAVQATEVPGVSRLQPRPLAEPLRPAVVLRGPAAACDHWMVALAGMQRVIRPDGLTLARWPDRSGADGLLVIDATVTPDIDVLDRVLRWTAMPGLGAVAAIAAEGRRRRSLGHALDRSGRALPITPGLRLGHAGPGLLACAPHEVAAAAGGVVWIRPPDWMAAALRGRELGWAGELLATLGPWTAGEQTLLLPDPVPHVEQHHGRPESAAVDLSTDPLWPVVRDRLPREFWAGDVDRFCPRHELLVELGLPAPVSARPAGARAVNVRRDDPPGQSESTSA